MGIQTLHKHLKSICEPVHVSDYRGCTAGIDAYAWLHRGAQACPVELCQGQWTDKFVRFCLDRVTMLKRNHVEPLLVFDGASVFAKSHENNERRRVREASLQKAHAATKRGNLTEARTHFSKAVFVTHDMAHQLIKALRKENIKFLVAPYEADAQLAYLSRAGLVDLVVTEDSDSLVYGCKRVLFKMDADGSGMEIQLRNLGANNEISFVNWSPDMFMDMCILSGCDYTPSIPGLGMKTAHSIVREHRTPNRILGALQSSKKFTMPEDFVDCFWRARATFRHMRVYDPQTRENVTMTPVTELVQNRFGGDLCFLGPHIPPYIAQDIAGGFIHPVTHEPWSEIYSEAEINGKGIGECSMPKSCLSANDYSCSAGTNTKNALDLDLDPHYSENPLSLRSKAMAASDINSALEDQSVTVFNARRNNSIGKGVVELGATTITSESFVSSKISQELTTLHKRRSRAAFAFVENDKIGRADCEIDEPSSFPVGADVSYNQGTDEEITLLLPLKRHASAGGAGESHGRSFGPCISHSSSSSKLSFYGPDPGTKRSLIFRRVHNGREDAAHLDPLIPEYQKQDANENCSMPSDNRCEMNHPINFSRLNDPGFSSAEHATIMAREFRISGKAKHRASTPRSSLCYRGPSQQKATSFVHVGSAALTNPPHARPFLF